MATPTPDPPPAPSADPPAGAAPARRGARPSPREVLVRVWAHRRARPEGLRRAGRAAGVVLVVLAGATLGAAMTPAVPASVGPLRLDVRVVPSLDPGVHLLLPPAGRVTFDTDVAPFAVEAAVSEVDPEKARALITSPGAL